jgi:hypothetical protein
MGQGAEGHNLGFGELYYALVRLLRPQRVVEIGSLHGFSAMCLAVGLRDNGAGYLWSIDPGLWDATWHTPDHIDRLRDQFHVEDYWEHLTLRSDQALDRIPDLERGFDLVLIDGDHTKQGARFDLEHYGVRAAWILLHDSHNPDVGNGPGDQVADALTVFRSTHGHAYEELTFPQYATLTLLRRL